MLNPKPTLPMTKRRRCQKSVLADEVENKTRVVADNPITSGKRSSWNTRDPEQIKAVKEALHVSRAPQTVVCREDEQNKILQFCKTCIETQKAGSLYVCGCPGTGKTLSIQAAKHLLLEWTKRVGSAPPEILEINCTTLSRASVIFTKILEQYDLCKNDDACTPLQYLQDLYCHPKQAPYGKMILVVVDEMDYLITKDKAVLHDLFLLTTLPCSRLVLIGIANSIDLADRFLPKLQSLNCKPGVITFQAYSKDQILQILQQRLMVLGYEVFQLEALEFCARKVAAASGDMRRALGVCTSAIELFEAELKDHSSFSETGIVRKTRDVTFDHIDAALSKAFKSPIVDTIKSLPQHQQMILCSLVKLLKTKKSSTTIGELNKSYLDICKSTQVPACGTPEFSNMCQVLCDQGLVKLGQCRQEKLKKVTLLANSVDVAFAFKEIRFFQSCMDLS